MQIKTRIFTLLIFFVSIKAFAAVIEVNPQNAEIIVPSQANKSIRFAAKELAKHLMLISKENIPIVKNHTPGKYPFYIGVPPKGLKLKMNPEEAYYKLTPRGSWFYGHDKINEYLPVTHHYNQTGTLFAVYNFLDHNMGIKWIEPGDKGIIFKPDNVLRFESGEYCWKPKLAMRKLRPGFTRQHTSTPEAFRLSSKDYKKRKDDLKLWLKRMRMGSRCNFAYGHSYINWWSKYGKSHPEYFALNKNNKRCPVAASKPELIKMCVSNPSLHKQIVNDWKQKRSKTKKVINICENDGVYYCRCQSCQALDVPLKGEVFDTLSSHMTDRYIYFANKVKSEAQKTVPDAKVVMYVYSNYRLPPRREKVEQGVILGFIPKIGDKNLEKYYSSWHKAGARENFLRPNDLYIDIGIPMGFEKTLSQNLQTGIKNGIFGVDYDRIHSYWPSSGIANYILARTVAEPDKNFEYWENEYYRTFGNASEDVKKYYQYWRREVWEKRLFPNYDKILSKGRYGNFKRGLFWSLQNYYQQKDFDITDKILLNSLKRNLSSAETQRIKKLLLANKHARLIYTAISLNNIGNCDSSKLIEAAQNLLNFRIKHKNELNINWDYLFFNEQRYGDVCGIQNINIPLKGYTPIKRLSSKYYFQIDPHNKGLTQKWFKYSYGKIEARWDKINGAVHWENAQTDPSLMKELKNYDGIVWYAQKLKIPTSYRNKKLYLMFGSVDESCWVYINGKEAGKHLFSKPDDWKTPFAIRIDPFINKDDGNVFLTVRVEDKSGLGGIWKPVWLVEKSTNKISK